VNCGLLHMRVLINFRVGVFQNDSVYYEDDSQDTSPSTDASIILAEEKTTGATNCVLFAASSCHIWTLQSFQRAHVNDLRQKKTYEETA
jgi:hypothetical protein